MKKAILKDSIVEIKKTYKRFVSLLLMAFLGVGFFAGIRSASPDMKKTLDNYYDEQNVFDFEIKSTIGLTHEDIASLSKISGIKIYPTYSVDELVSVGGEELVTKIHSISNDVNKLTVIDGRLPDADSECVVESNFLTYNNKKIGDYIEIKNSDKNNSLKENKLKIVGTIESPIYISKDRGISSLGSGKVSFFIYVRPTNIINSVYTEAYITLTNAKNLETGSKEYNKLISAKTKEINKVKKDREQKQYNNILASLPSNEILSNQSFIKYQENPVKWYVMDRTSNSGYNGFIQDCDSVANLGKVFPIVFFVIATLIGLTSMTRMVEEERTQLGMLKALGYNKFHIAFKYILYSVVSSVVGGLLGMSIGFYLLPTIIFKMYETMYTLPNFVLEYNFYFGLMGLGITILCIVGATMYVILKELRSTPATLMRPEAPKNGKRVLLENIPFIWKHLNFSNKVTVRNIFRYKKRFLMTIIGIFGCTSLILTGFGLKDSISSLLDTQYGHIFNYDMLVTTKNNIGNDVFDTFSKELVDNKNILKTVSINMQSGVAKNGKNKEDIQVIVPDNPDTLKNVILLEQVKDKKELKITNNSVYLTSKLASLLDAKVGSTIYITNSNNKKIKLVVTGIVSNYTYHYVYMSKELYEKFGEEYINNVILIKNKKNINEDNLAKEIMSDSRTSSVTLTSTIVKSMDDTLISLNYVVLVLIIASGILAFVVLYNLANVNISERKRELATIKVLGFYDKEVYLYVTRETILLTIMGIILGYGGGYYLNTFVLSTCEINILRFGRDIFFSSYVYATILTIVFTVIVNIITYFSLKKIDMIESLKSVE